MNAWEIFWRQLIDYEGYTLVLQGLRTTVIIAVCGLLIGLVLGSILAIFKLLPRGRVARVLGWISNIYVALFRGTPMVVQLLIVHFVLFPAIGLHIPAEVEGTIAFGMNSGAYICEIMRGGILSVDKGQMEAGRALGLGYGRTMIKVVLPQAVKNVVPTLGNEFIALIKETSVVSFIAVVDVTRAFQAIANSTYEYIVPYLMLAVVYLVLVLIVTLVIKIIEGRLRASDRR
ncbi:MAG TPA: amino acid ABC transporter permease [Firmicutes bacterium]|nr:amino acid ABC transporter permease [Bacillota bacterium]